MGDGRFVCGIEVARNSVTQHLAEFLKVFDLGENRMPERTRLIAVLGRFLDDKYDFAVGHGSICLTAL